MPQGTRREIQQVLLITLVLNALVAVAKIVVGMWSGALAITADGFHSLADGASNVGGLIGNYMADQPPDEDHPYGHDRFETLAALFIGALLLLTAWEVIQTAIERLNDGGTPEVTPVTIAVLVLTLGVNVLISRYERNAGKRLHSEILLADSANTGTDVYVTLSVLVSMVLVAFGWVWVDTIAALVVVVLIGYTAIKIIRRTGSVLVDTAPITPEHLSQVVQQVPAVHQVLRARSRGTADAAHIDIDVQVAPDTTAEESIAITDAIRQRLEQEVGGIAEVEVHFAPDAHGQRDYTTLTRGVAGTLGLSAHAVRVSDDGDCKTLELHVEVSPLETLNNAHAQVTALEEALRNKLPEIGDVITHIEPAIVTPSLAIESDQVITSALKLLNENYPGIDWHQPRAYPHGAGYALTLHAILPPNLTIAAAHHIAESASTLLRAQISELERVMIHTEPPE